MNALISSLSVVCRENLLSEKWLIAPSLRAGNQWVHQVVRYGHAVVNLRVRTLPQLAVELAQPEMYRGGLAYCGDLLGVMLVEKAWSSIPQEPQGYLTNLEPSWHFFRSLHSSIKNLRLADVHPEALEPQSFEVPTKGQELRDLLAGYIKLLHGGKWVDQADAFRMALEVVRSGSFPGVLVLYPEDLETCSLEQDLLESLPANRCIPLNVDSLWPAETRTVSEDREPAVQQHLFPTGERDQPPPGVRMDGFRGVGEVNEVREVLRRCLVEKCPLDEVEILHTDWNTYVPLIYETLEYLFDPEVFPISELPVTFEEGIPVRYSRPGRALKGFLHWVHEGCPQSVLVEMFREGLFRTSDNTISSYRLADTLRSLPIGVGKERYLSAVREKLKSLELEKMDRVPNLQDEMPDHPVGDRSQKKQVLETLSGVLKSLTAVAETIEGTPAHILDGISQLLSGMVRCVGEKDNYALEALQREIDRMKEALAASGIEFSSGDLLEWLTSLPDTTRILGSGPRPGKIHVSHILSGGHSGRKRIFILGLDDVRFPGSVVQDPILLDEECRKVSRSLTTGRDRLEGKSRNFERLLGRLRGHLSLSYSSRNILDNRECFPSPLLTRVYRVLTGDESPDLEGFYTWIGSPVSFAPPTPDSALDETDWWLSQLCDPDRPVEAESILRQRFPHLYSGIEAERRRSEVEDFSPYNGCLTLMAGEPDWSKQNPFSEEGPVLSVSHLEELGRCPLAYFFRKVLGVSPPEEIEVDPERWLDPLEKGILLHDVFCEFMKLCVERNRGPCAKDDSAVLEQILENRINAWKEKKPPPSLRVFRKEEDDLKETIRIFLEDEERHCLESFPVLLEVGFGLEEGGDRTGEGRTEPITVELGEGKQVRVRGRIDRIDRIDTNRYVLWDYKTGGSSKYENHPEPFAGGKILQHFLYLEAAQTLLTEQISPEAVPVKFGYFFPNPRGQGLRLEYHREDLHQGKQVLRSLCELVANGAFPPTPDEKKDGCAYCDFQAICGDTASVTRTMKRLLEEAPPDVLNRYATLKGLNHE